MTDLKDVIISQISLGKAHAVTLTNKGLVYTFGINNKGQCGRDYSPGATKEGKFSLSLGQPGVLFCFYSSFFVWLDCLCPSFMNTLKKFKKKKNDHKFFYFLLLKRK